MAPPATERSSGVARTGCAAAGRDAGRFHSADQCRRPGAPPTSPCHRRRASCAGERHPQRGPRQTSPCSSLWSVTRLSATRLHSAREAALIAPRRRSASARAADCQSEPALAYRIVRLALTMAPHHRRPCLPERSAPDRRPGLRPRAAEWVRAARSVAPRRRRPGTSPQPPGPGCRAAPRSPPAARCAGTAVSEPSTIRS